MEFMVWKTALRYGNSIIHNVAAVISNALNIHGIALKCILYCTFKIIKPFCLLHIFCVSMSMKSVFLTILPVFIIVENCDTTLYKFVMFLKMNVMHFSMSTIFCK